MKQETIERNPLLKMSVEFALKVIEYCDILYDQKKFIIANQLLKSGTSIGANTLEAQNPESRADFIHKMKIAGKEADETLYWLILCDRAKHYPKHTGMFGQVESLNKIIGSIISSAKRNQKNEEKASNLFCLFALLPIFTFEILTNV